MIENILVSILSNLTRATLLSLRNHISITIIYICYLPAGRSILEKYFVEVSKTARDFLHSREIYGKVEVHHVLRAQGVMGGPLTDVNKVGCHGFIEHCLAKFIGSP